MFNWLEWGWKPTKDFWGSDVVHRLDLMHYTKHYIFSHHFSSVGSVKGNFIYYLAIDFWNDM